MSAEIIPFPRKREPITVTRIDANAPREVMLAAIDALAECEHPPDNCTIGESR